MTVRDMKISIEELALAINAGRLPDGSDIVECEHLDVIAAMLDVLTEAEIEALLEATGGPAVVGGAKKPRAGESVGAARADNVGGDIAILDGSHVYVSGWATPCARPITPPMENVSHCTFLVTCGFSLAQEVFKGADSVAPPPKEGFGQTFVWTEVKRVGSWRRFWTDRDWLSTAVDQGDASIALSTVNGETRAVCIRGKTPLEDLTQQLIMTNGGNRPSRWNETESD